MKNNFEDLDLDLTEVEVQDETPSQKGEFERTERMFKKSLEIVQKAMENVVQEILITLEDGEEHIVYVTSLDLNERGQVSLEFSTLDESRKADLAPHVEKCIKIQIQQAHAEIMRKKKRFKLF